ncbi:dephospho-CoA kinase [Youxingia wuxianensis]|uniref:Dephospho-CoA kinase n=1 Tax=Youxingia wuxianensis TaxID=2763678 RepID=A0A926EM45_9FIRM|nr:dephospho-CoA kinase [Youxingia wuxianensis]MBC8584423.1 dephospho-CoA kinase [Youxingia wuxianensis]
MSEKGTMIVGLTGQTGAGKSTLSKMFSGHNVFVIDADVVARQVLEKSKGCLMDLVLEFSTDVIHPDATLNREKLAEIVFSDKAKLKRLNEITFPYIIDEIERRIEKEKYKGTPIVVLDAPTLYESGLDKNCHRVVAVIAPMELRRDRIIQRDQMTQQAAMRRINAQHDDEYYTSRADYILTNGEDIDNFRFSFIDLMNKLQASYDDGSYKLPYRDASEIDLDSQGRDKGELAELEITEDP